jgi:hypothetical protein
LYCPSTSEEREVYWHRRVLPQQRNRRIMVQPCTASVEEQVGSLVQPCITSAGEQGGSLVQLRTALAK